jgi:hypothetical protein
MTKQQYKGSLAEFAVSPELIRNTEHLMRRKRDRAPKRTLTIRYASAAACLVIALFAVIAFPGWIKLFPPHGSTSNGTAAISSSSEQNLVAADIAPSAGTRPASSRPSAASSEQQAVVRVNQLGDMIEQQPRGSGPMINRIEKWTFDRYCDLLGFDPLPTAIPEGLRLIENNTKDISFQNDRRVDFYNTWSFVYTGGPENHAKSVTVHVNPSSIPYWSVPRAYQLQGEVQLTDVDELLKLGKKSQIKGTEVTIWHKAKGSVWNYLGGDAAGEPLAVTDYYCADFKYKGAGFSVTAQNGITQDELVQVLESIMK